MRTMWWVSGERRLGGLADNVRDKGLQRLNCVRCVNCGSIDDSVIRENRLHERSSLCCTTH